MSDYDNTNSGALFKNDKGDNPKRPDYKGQLNVGGVEYWLSAWLRTSKDGKKYMGLKVEAKGEKMPATPTQPELSPSKQAERAADFNDDIPF